jgi:hypothetical protein
MKSNFYLCLAMLAFAGVSLQAQISFTNANAKLGYGNHFSGVAIGIADMNADGYDDIVHLSNGRILAIELQKPDGSGLQTITVGQISNASQWSMCIADADNNGFNDVLAGGSYDGVKLVRAAPDGESYTWANLPGSGIFLQGSNFADINNDGWLDVFACHDDAMSRIWGNDGTGIFAVENWIDMTTVPASDNSGNYGSVWTDFDNDGDLDLYIAKCRQGVNNPDDGRRINQLFVNNGDGTYAQDTLNTYGLRIGAQSWTADFGDVDNDGDFDCFITNHDLPSQLLLNDGTGVFTDVTSGSGINVQGLPIQGIFKDFDNDGFLDIIVSGSSHNLFRNNGDGTFTDFGDEAFGSVQMESYAVGDLNQDGKLDVYGGYANIYTSPSNIPDVIWLNTTANDNHYLTVRLEGTTSNRNAVGARISIFGDWGIQVREVRSGESYGIMNSFYQHFGLGQQTMADSLVVNWPSGLREVFYNVPADQSIQIVEGECISPFAAVEASGPTVFCPGETATLSVTTASTAITWSNGASGAELSVTESGLFSAVVGEAGCQTVTPAFEFTVNPPEFPVISIQGDTIFCPGGSVTLLASPAAGYAWSNGATTASIEVQTAGIYTVEVQGLCQMFAAQPVTIRLLDAPLPTPESDTITGAGQAVLTATGELPRWYDVPVGGTPVATGNTFTIPMLAATDTFYVENVSKYPGEVVFAGPFQHTGNSNYSGNNTNGQIIFDAHRPFNLATVKVNTDTPGVRIIELRNGNTVLAARTIDIPEGESVITLDMEIPQADNLILTTNTAQNQAVLGFGSPRLRRTSAGVMYPYETPNVVTIRTSNFGNDVYYYFYNWEIKQPDTECVSERVAVYAVVLEPSAAQESWLGDTRLSLSPNPAGEETVLNLSLPLHTVANLTITDLNGRMLTQAVLPAGQTQLRLDVQALTPGVYHLRLATREGVAVRSLVVTR